MKRFFACLTIAALLAAALCGCGMEDGIIYDNPTPTEAVTPMPTLKPEVRPEATNDAGGFNDMEPGRNGPDTDGSSSVSGTSNGSSGTMGSTGMSDRTAGNTGSSSGTGTNSGMNASANKNG